MHRVVGIFTAMGLVWAGGNAFAQAQQPAAPGTPPAAAQIAAALEHCFQCHGQGGVSEIPTRPSIAGQKAGYVERQLLVFRRAGAKLSNDDDRDADNKAASASALTGRSDPIMSHIAAGLSDAEITHVAAAVSKLSCDGGKAQDRPTRPSVKPRVAQRCESCHGENGISPLSHVPNIAGQKRGYLRRQLLIIRETAWGAAPRETESWRTHPIMERQAARISIEDVDALAQYYAALDCRGAVKP